MKTYARSVLHIVMAGLALSAACLAASTEDASVYLVHGIPGRDEGVTLNPQLPVDVFINDSVCYLKGFDFQSSSGPLSLPAGEYDIKISMANSLAPCTNPPIAESTLKVGAGTTVTEAIALNASGSPALETFTDNLSTVKTGNTRFTLANAADADTLEVTAAQELVKNPIKKTFAIKAGAQAIVDLPTGLYNVQATGSGGSTPLVSATVAADSQAADLLYFVGSASSGSLSLVTRIIPAVF